MRSRNPHRLPHVERVVSRGMAYLYYRRAGTRHPLPGPEGSAAFLSAYEAIHAGVDRHKAVSTSTVHDAVSAYYASADFHSLADASKRQYRWVLEFFRERAGRVRMLDITDAWVNELRDALKDDPGRWNSLRSRMAEVFIRWRRDAQEQSIQNPWREVRRLATGDSDQNRPWPQDFLVAVLRGSTPEFRALVTTLLLTTQRIGDVCRFTSDMYDPPARTLSFRQGKTQQPCVIHVPTHLAATLESMRGRHADRLLVSPRGVAWTTFNAQETLAGCRTRLGSERYTLHGLRATGPVALVKLGFSAEEIIRVTGHTDVAGLRPYLRGVNKYETAVPLQDALDSRFAEALGQSAEGSNTRKYAGVTGRAAAKAGKIERSSRTTSPQEAPAAVAKQLPNAKQDVA